MRLLRTTPVPIALLALVFFLIPLLSYFATSDFYKISLFKVGDIFLRMQPFQLSIVISSFLVGLGILSRQKMGYYAFFVFSLIMIAYNLWLIFLFLSGKNIHVAGQYVTSSDIGGNFFITIFLLGGLFYFLNKEISAPYFSPESRGWRRNSRETIPLPYEISLGDNKINGLTVNVSKTGALLPWDEDSCPEEGDRLTVNITYENQEGEKVSSTFESTVMRVTNRADIPGKFQLGLRFHQGKANEEGLLGLEYFLRERYAPRYKVDQPIRFGKETFEDFEGLASNISHDGLYIESKEIFKTGDEIYAKLTTVPPIRMEGRVTWSNPQGNFQKNPGFGVHIVLQRSPFRFRLWLLKVRIRSLKTR